MSGRGLSAEQAEGLREVLEEVSVAPLGRNYFRTYREVRKSVEELCSRAEGTVTEAELREVLDADDLDVLESVAANLETFAEEGIRRRGEVEPYASAKRHAELLEPYLALVRDRLGVGD